MEQEQEKPEEINEDLLEEDTVDTLTTHFRRTSRGRIVDLPRWAG